MKLPNTELPSVLVKIGACPGCGEPVPVTYIVRQVLAPEMLSGLAYEFDLAGDYPVHADCRKIVAAERRRRQQELERLNAASKSYQREELLSNLRIRGTAR